MDIELSHTSSLSNEPLAGFEFQKEYGDVLKAFEIVVDNERASPRLLEPHQELVQLILDYIQYIEALDAKYQQVDYQLMRLQTHRLEYLVQSYSKLRLEKILQDHLYYIKQPLYLTPDEQQYVEKYGKLWFKAFNSSMMERIKQTLSSDQLTAPLVDDLDQLLNNQLAESVSHEDERPHGLVCVICLEDIHVEGQFYIQGTQVMLNFADVQQLLADNQIKLLYYQI